MIDKEDAEIDKKEMFRSPNKDLEEVKSNERLNPTSKI